MSYWSPDDQEEVLVLTTKKPAPRWLRILLITLAVLAGLAVVVAAVVGWQYYSVHQRLKKDLAQVISEEEHLRSLGAINALGDLLDPRAPRSWRFRYLSSVRARKGRPEPDIVVEKVTYDGVNVRVQMLVDGLRQYRHYRLYAGKDWRRSPFIAKGWGYKQTVEDAGGLELVYWDEDESFAKSLAEDLPDLTALMKDLGLTPAVTRVMIIPQELGNVVRPGQQVAGLVVNSPHVDLIDVPPAGMTVEEMLRADLGRRIVADARQKQPVASELPGAARVQAAIDEVLAWHWAIGRVPDAVVKEWAAQLKGQWVSPATGLPPELITQLPPAAPDAAARLMMTWLLRQQGPAALRALSAALPEAADWDQAYQQAAGMTEAQVEEAAGQLMQP